MRHEPSTTFKRTADPMRLRTMLAAPVRAEWLVGALTFYLGLSELLLWRFLDVMPLAAYVAGGLLLSLLSWGVMRSFRAYGRAGDPSLAALILCVTVALVLFALGGEGRMFYSNIDWQVRDAVLRDMAIHPWPFVYTARGAPDVLRAPLATYFVPALAFKAWGARAGDVVLLLQNSLLLGALLALASELFKNARERFAALGVFIAFSGWDIVGELATRRFAEHMESWAGIQFSSTITLAFWVPQHALAGWTGALFYLLWRNGKRPLSPLLTTLPLTALWSPLALIGSMPFAAAAGAVALVRRELRMSDVVLPAGAVLLAFPGLLYMSAADQAVGSGTLPVTARQYGLFEALEVLPYLVPLAYAAVRFREDRLTLTLAGLCLLAAPFIRIGSSVDLTMRASIPALAVLIFLTVSLLVQPRARQLGLVKAWLLFALAIGAATGASEVLRSLSHPPSPRGSCSFFKAWDQNFAWYPKETYLAPLNEMPALVRPRAPVSVPAIEPARCWMGNWYRPSGA